MNKLILIALLSVTACGGEFTTQPNPYDGGAGMAGAAAGSGGSGGATAVAPSCGESNGLCRDVCYGLCDGEEADGACEGTCSGACCTSSAGSAGAGGGYDGPAWVECPSGELLARGLSLPWGDYEFLIMAEYHGSDFALTAFSPRINGEFTDGTRTDSTVSTAGTTQLISFRISNAYVAGAFVPDDVLSVDLGWSPNGGGEIIPAEPMRCTVLLNGFEIAAYP